MRLGEAIGIEQERHHEVEQVLVDPSLAVRHGALQQRKTSRKVAFAHRFHRAQADGDRVAQPGGRGEAGQGGVYLGAPAFSRNVVELLEREPMLMLPPIHHGRMPNGIARPIGVKLSDDRLISCRGRTG